MNIVVCVKYVPDATADRQFESDNTVDRVGVDGLLSELDEYAVEQALRSRRRPATTPRSPRCASARRRPSTPSARRCRWAATRASTSSTTRSPAPTPSPPGSDAVATSLVLAKAVEKAGPADLIVCGMASTDAVMSVVPAMLAERLDLPQVTLASVVETQGDQVRVKRDGDTATEVIGATMPLVLSVTDQSGEARYPSFKGIMAAKKKPLETWSLSDIGVDAGDVGLSVAWTEVDARGPRSTRPRPARRAPPARSSRTRTARGPRR